MYNKRASEHFFNVCIAALKSLYLVIYFVKLSTYFVVLEFSFRYCLISNKYKKCLGKSVVQCEPILKAIYTKQLSMLADLKAEWNKYAVKLYLFSSNI